MPDENRACDDKTCTESSCASCAKNPQKMDPKDLLAKTHELNSIKKVVGVVSGKGGVGKSLVTAMMAELMNRKGHKVGIMDADVTGPSIPKMLGMTQRAESNELGIMSVASKNGIKVMSINLLIDEEEKPVIWRGPMISGVVKQFWTDIIWGDLDFLFIDMPPGTGDVSLTVYQSIPIDGMIIVTSPQELVSMIVKKAFNMARQMNIPILGIVENMSYVKCPDCGREIEIFGQSKLEEKAKSMGIDILGRIPIDPQLSMLADEGRFSEFQNDYLKDAAEKVEKLL